MASSWFRGAKQRCFTGVSSVSNLQVKSSASAALGVLWVYIRYLCRWGCCVVLDTSRASSEGLPFSFSMPPKAYRADSMCVKLWGINKNLREINLRVYSQLHQSPCQLSHEIAFVLVLEQVFSVPGRAKAALQEGNSKVWRTKLNFCYYTAWKRIPGLYQHVVVCTGKLNTERSEF